MSVEQYDGVAKVLGLKKLRSSSGKRNPEWNRPNRKAAQRAAIRMAVYDKAKDDRTIPDNVRKTFNPPGSMNRRNQN